MTDVVRRHPPPRITPPTSCGYGVPLMAYEGDRRALTAWAEKKGSDGIEAYWRQKNATSIDGLPAV